MKRCIMCQLTIQHKLCKSEAGTVSWARWVALLAPQPHRQNSPTKDKRQPACELRAYQHNSQWSRITEGSVQVFVGSFKKSLF